MAALRRGILLLFVLVSAPATFGCSGGAPLSPTQQSISVIPPAGMFPGDSTFVMALGVPAGAAGASWVSSDPGVATVTTQGVVTAVAPGSTRLTITYLGSSGSAPMTVYGDADVLGLTIQECPGSLLVGQTMVCRAFARLRGGASIDVGFRAAWSSAAPVVARAEPGGLVIARSPGQTALAASYHGGTGSLDLSVAAGPTDTLRITSNAEQGPFRAGSEVQFWLQGFYAVVSEPAARLSLQVSDQNFVVAASTISVPQGGDAFLLTARFTISPTSTRLCPAVVLRAGAATISAPDDAMRFCVAVSP